MKEDLFDEAARLRNRYTDLAEYVDVNNKQDLGIVTLTLQNM